MINCFPLCECGCGGTVTKYIKSPPSEVYHTILCSDTTFPLKPYSWNKIEEIIRILEHENDSVPSMFSQKVASNIQEIIDRDITDALIRAAKSMNSL